MWNQSEARVCRFMRSVSADLSICYSCSPLAVAFSAPKASCCWRPSLRSPPKQASPKRKHFESLLTSAKVFASQRLLQSDALPFSCTDCTKSTFIFVFSLEWFMIQEADYLFVCMPPIFLVLWEQGPCELSSRHPSVSERLGWGQGSMSICQFWQGRVCQLHPALFHRAGWGELYFTSSRLYYCRP